MGWHNLLQLEMADTYKLIGLVTFRQQGPLVLLLVLLERLDVHVEPLAGRALGGLGGKLTLFKQKCKKRKKRVPGIEYEVTVEEFPVSESPTCILAVYPTRIAPGHKDR